MIGAIVPVHRQHDRERFDCGHPALNDYLKKYARQSRDLGLASTFVAEHESHPERVVGYYTLSMASIEIEDIPERWRKRLPAYPVPAARLSRLACDLEFQSRGLGTLLLTHALRRCVAAADTVAAAAIVVDAKPDAIRFYEKHGFISLNPGSLQLFLPMATARRL